MDKFAEFEFFFYFKAALYSYTFGHMYEIYYMY